MYSYSEFIKENFDDVIIKKISNKDIPNVIKVCQIIFEEQMTAEELSEYLMESVKWNISVMSLYKNEIIGCYLLSEKSILECDEEDVEWYEDINIYKNKRGIEGVALCILPEYRDLGIGKKLRNVPLTMNYDYVWGLQFKSLNNIDNWTKFGRRIVGENEELYVTLIDIK